MISLDPRHQEAVIDLVRRFSRDRGITVLFSAHELNQLLGALDRVLYLGRGQAVLGSIEEVVTAPVLSRLYGTDINVVHADGHIFVMSRGRDVERHDHLHHEHSHEHHQHSSHAGSVPGGVPYRSTERPRLDTSYCDRKTPAEVEARKPQRSPRRPNHV